MRIADQWQDFEILDTSSGEKLERWGNTILIRPDPQVIWRPEKGPEWQKADARYNRSSAGGGSWQIYRSHPQFWTIGYRDLKFKISPTGFKHTGLFPEQAVCHVDASKGMVAWARENQQLSGLGEKPIRWIVDDCQKFVEREIRRGSLYDGVIMDPPSYGRGPGGEVWKLEDSVYDLVKLCAGVLTENPLFFAINSYTTGLSPSVMEYILNTTVSRRFAGKGTTFSSEIGLPVTATGCPLPCGSTAVWHSRE